jgi:hypothetical protein
MDLSFLKYVSEGSIPYVVMAAMAIVVIKYTGKFFDGIMEKAEKRDMAMYELFKSSQIDANNARERICISLNTMIENMKSQSTQLDNMKRYDVEAHKLHSDEHESFALSLKQKPEWANGFDHHHENRKHESEAQVKLLDALTQSVKESSKELTNVCVTLKNRPCLQETDIA